MFFIVSKVLFRRRFCPFSSLKSSIRGEISISGDDFARFRHRFVDCLFRRRFCPFPSLKSSIRGEISISGDDFARFRRRFVDCLFRRRFCSISSPFRRLSFPATILLDFVAVSSIANLPVSVVQLGSSVRCLNRSVSDDISGCAVRFYVEQVCFRVDVAA